MSGAAGSTLRVDLHLHTAASGDSLSRPERVLERALERGLDRIAVTDHNTMQAASALAAAFPGQVIPGEEVKTREGVDVIGLYLVEEIPKGTPALETCRRIREQGGIVYLPHPFAPGKGGSGRLAATLVPHLDVIEVFNARLRQRWNRRAAGLAATHGLPVGAGSDAHTLGEIGSTWIELPAHDNEAPALLAALSSGGRISGRQSPPWVFLASNWAKVRKRLPGGRYAPAPGDFELSGRVMDGT